ncbi:Alpha/Beta hydrolase protein, partial [Kalaharituber pfeilii]
PLPLVVWHGLGDAYDSPGLQRVADLYHLLYPNTFVYIISLSSNPNTDRSSTFLGSLPAQISLVCQQLLSLPSLSHGYHSLGFSQGGQFLRALIQSCPLPHLASHPPTSPPRPHALITFGAQHNGITSFLGQCAPFDVPCKTAAALLNRSKWSPWVQSHVVPAQYFRDPTDLDNYLAFSGWLADVNNERSRNESFAENLASLDNFVMYLFANDTTAIPKESAWFDDVDPDTGEITKLRDRDMYKEDWLGLRKLDEKGALTFLEVEGAHMEIADETLLEAF